MPKRNDKERQADAVTEETNRAGRGDDLERRPLGAAGKRNDEIDGASDETLEHGNLHGIGERDLAG